MCESYKCEYGEILQLSLLEYECNGYSQLINWLITNKTSDYSDQKIEEFKTECMKCHVKKQALMKAMIKKYVPVEYQSDKYEATFDYDNMKVTVREQSSCCD